MPGKEDDDQEEEVNPFAGIQTGVVVREGYTLFNEQTIKPAKCIQVLTKILCLINRGEIFSDEEATQVFFAVTKLFQSQDLHLRRLVYLVIKELRVASDSSLIVVSCLQKDMTSTIDPFRANSIRVLAKVMDASMVGNIERFLKQSIVDKNPFIVASTLVASQHIWTSSADIIKRWTTQIQDALNSPSPMVQFHALTLLYKIKASDRLAITKVVAALVKNPPKSSLTTCLLIRIVASDIATSATPNPENLKFLTSCLHSKNFMVTYEAARTMCTLQCLGPVQVSPAISVLQELLGSPQPSQRFAAVRTLSEIVQRFPLIVTPCSADLERLLTDSNRSIGILAITTLLKTGAESNVDRLIKSISGFMSEISDEFRIIMVDAVKTLAVKFPAKHQSLMNFLSGALREEGGFKYKKAIVDAIFDIIQASAEATEAGLEHFCEFIEDCEFPELSAKIIHILCDRGPSTSNPARYIRFIFNRVILETASVRAAAVTAMGKFAVSCPSLADSVIVLLRRCMGDNDDEVRDRCAFYLNMLEKGSEETRIVGAPLFQDKVPAMADFEYSLQLYLQTDKKQAFNLNKHIVQVEVQADEKPSGPRIGAPIPSEQVARPVTKAPVITATQNPYLEVLRSIPDIAALGPLFKSCNPVEVTETENEYVVQCIKHIYSAHVVFQFNITNNMDTQFLENVSVAMQPQEDGWEEEFSIPEAKIPFNVLGSSFLCMSRGDSFRLGSIASTLKFTYKDVEDGEVIEGSGVDDEYQLEELEVTEADFMRADTSIGLVEFRRQWETFGDNNEVVKKFNLGVGGLQAAVDTLLDLLGLGACEGSNIVAEDARSHAVNLAGLFLQSPNPIQVLARAGVMLVEGKGVNLKIHVRSASKDINEMLCSAIH